MIEPNSPLQVLIQRTLSGQPLREAPTSVESRVLAELARRAALPWWRKSFAHWPVSARLLFCVASIGCAKLGVDAALWVVAALNSSQVAGAVGSEISLLRSLISATSILMTSWSLAIRSIPPLWLYGGLACIAALYASIVGLGAAAYRTLYATR